MQQINLNPSYTFVREVSQLFDKEKFPNTNCHTDNSELIKNAILLEKHSVREIQEITDEIHYYKFVPVNFPDNVQAIIASFLINNTTDWLYTTGQLNATKKTRVRDLTTDSLAKELLGKLGVEIHTKVSPTKQLWDQIFQEVYSKADTNTKQRIIALAAQYSKEGMQTTKWEIRIYRIGKVVSQIFNNTLVKIGIGFIVWETAGRVIDIAKEKIQSTYVPILVNRFINVASPLAVRSVNLILEQVEKIYENRFKIYLVCLAIRFGNYVTGIQIPLVSSAAQRVSDIVYLPYTLTSTLLDLPWKLGKLSYTTQTKISKSLEQVSDKQLQETLDLGGRKAYRLWMQLMEQANKEGLSRVRSYTETH